MIVLINGSTCGVTYSFLRKSHPNGCFDAFDGLLQNGEAKLFWWAKCVDKLNFWESINPFKVFGTYQIDKKYIKTMSAQNKLGEFLGIQRPKIIIAHSVGCEYLLEYLANYKPKGRSENKTKRNSLEQIKFENQFQNQKQDKIKSQNNQKGLENLEFIYLLQSDCVAKKLDLTEFINIKISKTKKVQIYNYFCPFDTALIFSVMTNLRIPDGLFGSQNLDLQNRFVFLNDISNLHATMPKSTKFANKITKKLKNLD